jgi:hypothetical protein
MQYQPQQPQYGAAPVHQRNLLVTVALILVTVFLPLVGHIILTAMILTDDLSLFEKIVWLVVVWVAWFIGPLAYLLVGQRKNRLLGGHSPLDHHTPPQYTPYQPNQSYQQPQYPRD